MLRDKSLIPLSRQHQHALALCVRIDRASPISDSDLAAWQTEITQLFQSEIGIHFAAEELVLFPAAARINELAPLVGELLADHTDLRAAFVKAEAHKSVSRRFVRRGAASLRSHPQRRAPTFRTHAGVAEPGRTRAFGNAIGRRTQGCRADLHSAHASNHAAPR